jgi:carboxymethylenebutenolidase
MRPGGVKARGQNRPHRRIIFASGISHLEAEMFLRAATLASCLFLTTTAFAAGVKTQTVHLRAGNETVTAYLAVPSSPGRHPGLVVIHEWWGLNDWVKEQTRKFAAAGYVSLAVDLYRGQVATQPAEAAKLMRSLPRERAVSDMKAAYDFLAARRDVNPQKIGSVGWCMGGGYSLDLAIAEPRLAACIINYGELTTDPAEISKIHAPLLGNFGGLDHYITPAKVHAFEKAVRAEGKSINAKIYPDANHAFENPNNKGGYRAADAANAWQRMVTFLDQKLK